MAWWSSGSGSWQNYGNDWGNDWWQEPDWSDHSGHDQANRHRPVDVTQYSWLGGSKQNSLPLAEQRKLLRESVLENVSALSMLGWASETLCAVFWICFAVDVI